MTIMGGFCEDPFWDSSLLLNGSWPQFTECFQDTALVWLPCGFLWLFAPLYSWYLASIPGTAGRNTYSKKFLMKLNVAVCLLVVSIIEMCHIYFKTTNHHIQSKFMAAVILAATLLLSLIFMVVERKKKFVTSGLQFLFWGVLLISNIIPFYTHIELKTYDINTFDFSIFYIKYAFFLAEFVLHCFAEEQVRSTTSEKEPNPEAAASFPSQLIFSWMSFLILRGYKRPLTESSLPDIHSRNKSRSIVPTFLVKWSRAVLHSRLSCRQGQNVVNETSETAPLLQNTRPSSSYTELNVKFSPQNKKTGPSLIYILVKTFWLEFTLCQVWKLFENILMFCNPLLLGLLVAFTKNSDEAPWKGYVLAIALCSSACLQSLFFNRLFHYSNNLGLQIRACLVSAIFRKALTMDNASLHKSPSGEVVNLMSVDADNIQDFVHYAWAIWSSPLQIAVSLYLLYNEVGLSMFAGAGFLVLLVPINGLMTTLLGKLQTKLLAFKDERMKIMNELLAGIKIIKLFAWEESFEKKVLAIRNNELKILYKFAYMEAGFSFSWSVAPYLVSLLTFLTYVYVSDDHYLDPQRAFVAISLFNIIKFAINFTPMVVTEAVKAVISARRIQRYLNQDDLDENSVTKDENASAPISINNGTFSWSSETEQSTLRKINLTIPDQSLVAVVGAVGSGKSSLLSAMLGEIKKVEGTVVMRGSISYVPQQAWIQNNTLRNNILFGKDYNPEFYNQCLEACALGPDLQMLPDGDQTEIGEKGINLSGGQKQRVSLARAIYSQSDIYLLDDPLSAVDSHVGKHIFNQVLSDTGLLAGKVRVLVTHGLHWLPHTDQVIVMVNGQVSEIGRYEDLLSHKGYFARLVTSFLTQKVGQDEDDEYLEMKRTILRTLSETMDEDCDGSSEPHQKVFHQLSETLEKSLEVKELEGKETTTVNVDGGLIEEEAVETGSVKWSVVKNYGRSIGYSYLFIILFFYLIYVGTGMGSNLWLTTWTDDHKLGNFTQLPRDSSERMNRNDFYLIIYGAFGIGKTFAVLVRAFLGNYRAVHASGIIHQSMLSRILHAPMSFFDTTPIGRIVNRFSKDLNDVDETLPMTFNMWMDSVLIVLSGIVIISYSTPIFTAFILPLMILYFFFQRFYIASSRQLKRLSSKTKSPIFNHFSETLTGAPVIRAFRAQKRFVQESEDRVDTYQIFAYFNFGCNRWLGTRLDFVGYMVVLLATIIAVSTRENVSAGIMGLLINYAMELTEELNWMVRMTSDLETQIVAVERIKEYSEVDIEAPWYIEGVERPLLWPEDGRVEVDHLSLRYRPGLELVLKDVSFTVQAGEMMGIVGRTGAGKSSLTQALFRLIEPAGGTILIDGVDITALGLHDLRSKITILPQDPVIFSGSLHQNLDPFDEYDNEEVWTAVRHCHLASFVESLPNQLEHECGEGGENLSYGQRQLLCLGRALLRKSKILILDEATAAVDMETDEMLQKTIREEFRDCTVMTIAHRLNTVMDYDRILVLDKGEVNDLDTPANLLKKTDGLFYSMAKTANIVT